MLHRVKKENDINKDKWIGIGGKFEGNESPDECLLREAWEETGLKLTSWKCRGVVTFLTETGFGEFMYLFTADGFEGERKECDAAICGGSAGISSMNCPNGREIRSFWTFCGRTRRFSC